MSIAWPDQLIKDIARKRCVLFLGSGISANSVDSQGNRPPTWKEFLAKGIDRLPNYKNDYKQCANKYIQYGDLLMTCEVVRKGLGRDEFVRLLHDNFFSDYKVAEIHKDIFDLDSRIVITPNFDRIYDTYAGSETQGTTVVKKYTDPDILDWIRRDRPLIIKMHGSIESADNIIFTRKDYAKAWNTYPHFYRIIESLLLSHTFLFLGAGMDDPDIRLLLESSAFSYGITRRHYFVIPEESLDNISRDIYSETLNLEFLTYSKNDNHKELKDSIKELKISVESTRRE